MFLKSFALLAGAAAEPVHEGLDIWTIVATVATFLVLLLLLKKFAFGPLMNIMREREQLVASDMEAAEKARQESAGLLQQQKDLLDRARQDALVILENAKKQGEASRQETVEAARAEAERVKESALRDIQTEKQRAVEAVREEVVSLSILAASRVLGKEVSEADNRALIEETIAKAGEAN